MKCFDKNAEKNVHTQCKNGQHGCEVTVHGGELEVDGTDGEKQTKERKRRAKPLVCQTQWMPGLAVNKPFCFNNAAI